MEEVRAGGERVMEKWRGGQGVKEREQKIQYVCRILQGLYCNYSNSAMLSNIPSCHSDLHYYCTCSHTSTLQVVLHAFNFYTCFVYFEPQHSSKQKVFYWECVSKVICLQRLYLSQISMPVLRKDCDKILTDCILSLLWWKYLFGFWSRNPHIYESPFWIMLSVRHTSHTCNWRRCKQPQSPHWKWVTVDFLKKSYVSVFYWVILFTVLFSPFVSLRLFRPSLHSSTASSAHSPMTSTIHCVWLWPRLFNKQYRAELIWGLPMWDINI